MRFPKSTAVGIRVFAAALGGTLLLAPVHVFARPGGGGGGRPGPEPVAGGRGGPAPATRPAPGHTEPGHTEPGRVESGRVDPGRTSDGGAANRPAAGTRDVDTFLNTKPATGAAAKSAADPAAAKSRAEAAQSSFQTAMEGRTQPFTPAWYGEHPDAWQYTHPHADLWAVAGVASLSSWLGYPATAAGTTTTAVAATASSSTAAVTANGTTTAAAASATADAGAASGSPPSDLEWMSLGVYATGPKDAAPAHVYQQLAVSKQGELKGNYYDSITDATQPVSGSIDRETRKATWKVGGKGGATFETTLDALTKTPSSVTMKSGGAAHEWELVQVQKPNDKPAAR